MFEAIIGQFGEAFHQTIIPKGTLLRSLTIALITTRTYKPGTLEISQQLATMTHQGLNVLINLVGLAALLKAWHKFTIESGMDMASELFVTILS